VGAALNDALSPGPSLAPGWTRRFYRDLTAHDRAAGAALWWVVTAALRQATNDYVASCLGRASAIRVVHKARRAGSSWKAMRQYNAVERGALTAKNETAAGAAVFDEGRIRATEARRRAARPCRTPRHSLQTVGKTSVRRQGHQHVVVVRIHWRASAPFPGGTRHYSLSG